MALTRLALKNSQQTAASSACQHSVLLPCCNYSNIIGERLSGMQGQGWRYGILQRLSSSASSDGKEVAVQVDEGGRKRNISSKWRSLLPRPLRNPASLWGRKDHDRYTQPFENFPPASIGNALLEAAHNMNRVFENVIPTQMITAPTQLMGMFKETDESYKLRYDMPGLTKDDVKVTIDDGVLRIRGERKVVEDDESDDEYFMSYGYYNTSLVLPDDAKLDDIKAELKDGVLTVTIPKTESHGKDVKEITVN